MKNQEITSLVDLLEAKVQISPDKEAYIFLADGKNISDRLTYQELAARAKAIAADLQSQTQFGERVILLYPAGLEFITVFFGCIYAGIIAIPLPPPDMFRSQANLSLLQEVIDDAEPTLVLTTAELLPHFKSISSQYKNITWLTINNISEESANKWQEVSLYKNSIAYLQYTSGSTSLPKGVNISHGNLLDFLRNIVASFELTAESIAANWQPHFHDGGLVGGLLTPLYAGTTCYVMSPLNFIKNPLCWLEVISQYQITFSGGSNFAYDHCVDRINSRDCKNLDLSNWQIAFNGAEPIKQETFERFAKTFADYGFQNSAFCPGYGLAENTLTVTTIAKSEIPNFCRVEPKFLVQNKVVATSKPEGKLIVSCGQPIPNTKVVIVNPTTYLPSPPNEIGEIWVQSSFVSAGYWNKPEATTETFQAYLADTKEGPFLRTGDLGFLKDGQLFVKGRLKDLIIIRGKNYYPQDIEFTVEKSHTKIRDNCSAVFAIDIDGVEKIVVAVEVDTHSAKNLNCDAIIAAIREEIAKNHELPVHAIVLLQRGSIPKTSSGKVQRHACRSYFLSDSLSVVAASVQNKSTHHETKKLEETLIQHPNVAKVVVITLQDQQRKNLFLAYIVPTQEQVPTLENLRHFLQQKLPSQLNSTSFVPIESFPLTAKGDLDYNALPIPHGIKLNVAKKHLAPRNLVEEKLVGIWADILWLENPISINDNFFELGGNSLLAASLIDKVEQEFNVKISPENFPQLTTIANLGILIKQQIESNFSSTTKEFVTQGALSRRTNPQVMPEIHHKVLTYVSGWQGKRERANSLIVGLNTAGTKQNLFWCLQGFRELSQLAKYLGEDQPVYGMRSGHLIMDLNSDNSEKIKDLAAYYVSEILSIQPESPYLLGGNCQGAWIIMEIAQQLKAKGKTITLLCLMEQFVPQTYPDRVALFFGRESRFNPYKKFLAPELGYRKYYAEAFSVNIFSGKHGEFFNEPNIQVLAEKLRVAIEKAQLEEFSAQPNREQYQLLPPQAYQAEITVQENNLQGWASEPLIIWVKVKNISSITWESTDKSGIRLGNHWLNEKGEIITYCDGIANLNKPVVPGSEIRVRLLVKAPQEPGSYQLELDLLEEGITCFEGKDSKTTRVKFEVLPVERNLLMEATEYGFPLITKEHKQLQFPFPHLLDSGPNIIGATGGSGTRTVARIAQQGGMFMGNNRNRAEDSLAMLDYLSITKLIAYWQKSMPIELYTKIVQHLESGLSQYLADFKSTQKSQPWGWKLPPNIAILPFLHSQFPQIKCLHLVRDGRDMAYSRNQNQLQYLGPVLLNLEERSWNQPLRSIALWSKLNLLTAEYGEKYMPSQYLRIRFEDLCHKPVLTIERIFDFFGLSGDIEKIAQAEVTPPRSLERWRNQDLDIAQLHRIGGVALQKFGYLEAEKLEFSKPNIEINLQSQNSDVYSRRGNFYFEKGDAESALVNYQKAIKMNRAQPGEVYQNLGNAFRQLQQWSEAIAAYKKALELEPDNAQIHFMLGKTQLLQENLTAAAASFQKAIELEPEHGYFYENLGEVLNQLGQLEAVIAVYTEAIKLGSNNANIYCQLAAAQIRNGDVTEATALYQKAIKLVPDHPTGYNSLAHIQRQQKGFEAAILSYRRSLELNPQQFNIYIFLGTTLFQLGKAEEAITAYTEAIALKPDHAPAYSALGNAQLKLGNFQDAIAVYEKAIELNSQQPFGIYRNLGDALKREGKIGSAIAAYEKAIELKPHNKTVLQRLASIEITR